VEVGPSRCTSSFGTVASGETSSGIVAWSGSAQLLLICLVCVDSGINRSSIGCKIIWPVRFKRAFIQNDSANDNVTICAQKL
jgi:hypothetical protein